ncbi:hypothetical protein FRC08_015830 [Ceratobasidium sp. 394]|nr:hypothetical protein FRC08_015830 [Ceratobasidium sp. 394]
MEEQGDHDGVDLRKTIDKDLPRTTRCSLEQWCERRKALKPNRQQCDKFTLTGHYTDEATGVPTRSRIDFHDHRIPDNITLVQHCDVDSVLGVVKGDFPIADGVVLKYFMLSSPTHTLDSDLHLPPVKVLDHHGEEMFVDLHKIPNARFFEMEPQALVRVCFPLLEPGPGKSNCVPEGKLKLLYDHAVREAALDTLPEELTATWPAEWDDERFRAAGNGRGRPVQHTGRDVHSAYLNRFVARMRQLVDAKEELAWARSFVFLLEMRGLKTRDGSMHAPPEPDSVVRDGFVDADNPRVRAVEQILSAFHTADFEPGCWFIDLGLNFKVPSPHGGYDCPLPAVEAHASILAHILGADMATCIDWVRGRGGHYQRDELAQLKAVGGFRFVNPDAAETGIHYIQLYTSDKSITYNLNLAHKARRITTRQVLDDWDKVRKDHFQPILAALENASAAHDMSSRIEVRIDTDQFPFAQQRVPDELARGWHFAVPPKRWWGWRFGRMDSAYSVMRMMMGSRSAVTAEDLPAVGSLLVSLVWMANALVNRPDEGGTWNEVRDASSVHDMSEGVLVPVWPLQAHFLHSLRFAANQPPRLSSLRTVGIEVLRYLCSTKHPAITEAELHDLISQPQEEAKKDLQPDVPDQTPGEERIVYPVALPNKQRIVKTRTKERQPALFAQVLPERPRVRRYESEDEDYEERPRPTPLSQQLTDIIYNLPLQIFVKAPEMSKNKQQGGSARRPGEKAPEDKRTSWCALQRNSPLIEPKIFSKLERIEDAFPSRADFGFDQGKWDAMVELMFPTIDTASDCNQGLRALAARIEFVSIQRKLPPAEREEFVNHARNHVNQRWAWMPYGVPRKNLWCTGEKNVPKSAATYGLDGGPWIIKNPSFDHPDM